jgi:hypothetical protein
MTKEFTLDDIRARPEDYARAKERPAKKAGERKAPRFTKVPHAWAAALADAKHIKTYPVAIHLLDLAWKEQSRQRWAYSFADEIVLPLGNAALAELGVSREQKRRALRELEALGLIQVEWRDDKSPLVRPVKL